jgi:hypothetical protein
MSNEKLVAEIMYLSVLVNANTDLCVFVRYYGHVDGIDLDISESKENCKARVFDDYTYGLKTEKLESFRNHLTQILDEHNVPYDKIMFAGEEMVLEDNNLEQRMVSIEAEMANLKAMVYEGRSTVQ